MKNKKNPKKLIKYLIDKLDLATWEQDQNIGFTAQKTHPNKCCFGLRIAEKILTMNFYIAGSNWFYREFNKLGWSPDDVRRTMRYCGASILPFSRTDWFHLPTDVFKQLLKIEKPITLAQLEDEFLTEEDYNDENNIEE